MPSEQLKTTHWSPSRTTREQSIIDAIKAGTIKRAIPRDALTGRPLDPNAQTMTGWYLPASLPSGTHSEPMPHAHLPRALTRMAAWDATREALPDAPRDTDTDADADTDDKEQTERAKKAHTR